MAKHGIVTVDAEGVATFTEGAGVGNYLSDALTTLPSTTKSVVGYGALVQRAGLFLLGNTSGIQSVTGRWGVGIAGKNFFVGK